MDATPTRLSATIFAAKSALLQARRSLADLTHPIPRHPATPGTSLPLTAAQSITPLWTEPDGNPSEQWYQTGKIANIHLAAAHLHNIHIPAGQTFSFWRQVGRASAARGYQPGRMLQEGCMVPSVGGGLCQLSNALYQVALDAGCEILERHRHSRLVPGSATAANRDATVAWNYVDLRFSPPVDMQLTVQLTSSHLLVALHASILPARPLPPIEPLHTQPIGDDHACDTCGASHCFRKHASPTDPPRQRPPTSP